MKRATVLRHEFVEYIPNELKEGTIYVSIAFATAAHKCCCGCGNEVITPISPTDWQVTFDGESISLHPSIGNWNFACRSHYWITRNRVTWARRWSQQEIETGRAHDRWAKRRYSETTETPTDDHAGTRGDGKSGLWRKLKMRFSKRSERGSP